MGDFFLMVRDFWFDIITLFNSYPFKIGEYQVSYFALILAFLVVGLVVSVFWKGAKT